MKKALVWKEEKAGRVVGQVERIGEPERIDPLKGNLYNSMVKVEVPTELEDVPLEHLEGVFVPAVSEFWSKEGEADTNINPQDESWTHHPTQESKWVLDKKTTFTAYDKGKRIEGKFKITEEEVVDAMSTLYGTSNPHSAVANYLTWMAMQSNPSKFVGLKARFETASFSLGDVLNTVQKITDYSSELLSKAEDYALYREEKILAFIADKTLIEDE